MWKMARGLILESLVMILTSAAVSLASSQSGLEMLCSSQTASGMHVSVNTLRSPRGNWITKLDLERGGGGGGRGLSDAMRTEPWTVDVDSNTRTCEGAESTLHVTLVLTAPLPKVGEDYELFPGVGYYKFHKEVTTWPLARQLCADEGAHLAIINSEKESEVMKTLIARHPTIPDATSPNYVWTGMQRKSGEYVTLFGNSLNSTGFMRWHTGEPNKGVSDDCLLVTRGTGRLADVHCEWKVAYICEIEL